MIKSVVFAAVMVAGALSVGTANAGVSWSVDVNAPGVGAVVSGGPGYRGPSYGHHRGYGPVYAPVPAYRVAPPVAYYPPPVYYRPAPVVYPRAYPAYPVYQAYPVYPGWRHGHRHGDWHGRGHR